MTKIANIDAVFDAMIQKHVEIYFDFLNGIGRKRNDEEEKQKEEEIDDIDVSLDEDDKKENESNKNDNSNDSESNGDNKEESSLVVTPITNGKDDKVQTAKQKKQQIQHERKKVLFSKICKYIFYLLILFTCYFTVKQVIHLLNTTYNPDGVTAKQSTTSTQVIEEEEETKEMLELNEQQTKRHPNKLK